MRRTGIIILNYNNSKDTINCIESVEKYNTAPVKYFIVDNGSTNKSSVNAIIDYIKNKFTNNYSIIHDKQETYKLNYINFFISETNDGYAKGNNKGLKLAYNDDEIEDILILNNDILFVEDIIPTLKKYHNSINDIAIISPILYKKDLISIDYNCARKNTNIWSEIRKRILFLYYLVTQKSETSITPNRFILLKGLPKEPYISIELPSGSCMFTNKNYFKMIGSFDEKTFLYWEENILYEKIKQSNKKNYLCTNVRCIHLGASSTSKSTSSFIVNCDINSMLYYFKHYNKQTKFLYAILKLSCLIYKFQIFIKDIIKYIMKK